MKLLDFQLVLNSEREEELVRGLERATKQILREHGYDADPFSAVFCSRPEGNEELILEGGGEDEAKADSHAEEGEGEESDDDDQEEDEEGDRGEDEEYGDLLKGMEESFKGRTRGEADEVEVDEDEEDDEEEDEEDDEEEEEEEEDGEEGDVEGSGDDAMEHDGVDMEVDEEAAGQAGEGEKAEGGPRREVQGLLKEYLESSPEAAELQQLWELEKRKSWKRVCEKHSLLLAAILTCLQGTDSRQGPLLSRRTLSERSSDLHLQLISNNHALATSTLCLLAALVRFSSQAAREVLLRVSLVSKPVLHLFSPASGKTSRRASVGLVAWLLRVQDGDVVARVVGNERLLSAVSRSLGSDQDAVVLLWLSALRKVLHRRQLPLKSKRRLFSYARLDQLRRLYAHRPETTKRGGEAEEGAHSSVSRADVLEALDRLLRYALSPAAGLFRVSAAASSARAKVVSGTHMLDSRSWALVRLLLGLATSADDARQRQLVLHVLQQYPRLSPFFMRRLTQSWEPRTGFQGLASYSFLASLLLKLPLPPRPFLTGEHDHHHHHHHHRGAWSTESAERFLSVLLPAGVGKRELTKATLSPDGLLQRAGLILVSRILQRVSSAVALVVPPGAPRPPGFRAVGVALAQRLPELQSLLALRTRCLASPSSGEAGMASARGMHVYLLMLQVLRGYHELMPEMTEAARFDFLRLINEVPDLSALSSPVLLELLRLLGALGPQRLQWLPPDPQAWASGHEPAHTALTQLLRLLVSEEGDGPLRRQAAAMVSSLACNAGAPGEALVAALLDCRSVEGSAAFLEFALRLTAHQPYAFALLALRGGVPSRVSAIVPTMLFLVGTPGDEDEASPIRSELQGFGLHVDKLRGRFAGSKGAKAVTRKLLLSVAAGLEAAERSALAALVARLGASDVATEVVAAGLGGNGGVKAARKKLQEAMVAHASKTAGKKRRREGQEAAVVDCVASVLGSLGAQAARTEEGRAVVADALCWAAEAVGHADVAERLGGVLRQWMALGKEEGGAAFDLYSLGEDKAERVAAMLPLDLLVELAAVAASAGEKKRRKAVKRSLSAALQRAEAVAGLLPGTARACAELERLSSSTGEGGQSDLLLWLLVATACRAWELGGVQGMNEVLLAVMKAGEGGAEGSFITSPAVATVLRTFLPVLLAREARRPLERWTRRWLLPSEEQHAGLRSSIIGLLLLSPALGAAGQATLTRRLVMGLMGPGGGEDGSAEWVGLVVHQLLGPVASDNKDRRQGHDWLLEPHAAAALRAVWRTAGGAADGEAGLALPQIAAMVHSVLEADADGRARRLACPEAAAWCWEELARGGNECVTAGRLLAELCRASDTCCLQTLERLSRMVRGAAGGLQSSLPCLLLGLGPVVAVLVRRLGAEDEEPRMRSALEMLLRPLVEAWLRVATEEGSECDERKEVGVVSGLQSSLDWLVPQSAAAGRSKAQAGLIENCASLAAAASAEEDATRPLALPCLTVLVRWLVTRDPSQGHLVGGLAARACKEARSMMVDDGEEEPSSLDRPLACLKSLLRAEETQPLLAAGSWGKELVRLGEACCSGSGGEALLVVKDLLVQRGSSKGVARMLQSLANNPNLSGWLHPSSAAALPLVQLLLWLFSRAGNAEVGKQLLPPLVHGYRGSMSATDRLMLRLMWIISSDAGVEMKLGPWLRPGQAVEEAGGVEAGSAEWVVQWMDVQAVYRTLAAFPLQRPLYPPRTRWEEEGDEEEAGEEGDEEESSGRREAGAGAYDPAFVLPLADAYLRSEADCSLRGLQSSGMMALAMVSLSSRQRAVRLCACSVLQHMATRLEEAPRADAGSKERPQLSLLLRLLGTSLTASLDPLPYGVALFMARACHVMGSPANDLYVALNTFLLKRNQLSLEDLPLFYELFYSSRPFHRRELVWVLRLMGDSLQTSEDLSIHRRRHYLSLLLLWLDGAANHSSGGADDSRLLAMGLAVIKAAAKIPGGTEHLINEVGLLAWAGGMLHAAAPPPAGRKGGGPPSSPKLLGHAVLVLEALEAVLQQRWTDATAPGGAQQLAVLVQTLLAFAATLSSTRGRTPPPPVRQALRLVLRCLAYASHRSDRLQLSMADARRLVDCADLASAQPRQSKQQADQAAEQDRVMVLKLLLDAEPAAGAGGRAPGWSAIGGSEEDEEAMAVEDEEAKEGDEGEEARKVKEGEGDLLALLSWCTSAAASCLHQAPLQPQEQKKKAIDALELCSRTGEWALSLLQRRPSLLAPLCADGGAATAVVAKSPFWPALLQIVYALCDPPSASSDAGMTAWVALLLLCCLQRAGGGASAVLQAALAECRAARQEDDDVRGRRLRRLAHLAAHAGCVFGEGAIDPAAEAEEVAAMERARQPSSWRSAIGADSASAPSPLTGSKKRRSEEGGKQKKTPTKVRKKARAEGGS